MMDEQLIDEVAHHGVIFNRQKYYLNGSAGGGSVGIPSSKYETKDEAWQTIAMKLRTDVDTCKKRWKYLRERYVSQRKSGDPPVYEHLSRPYLEKMKFLDSHIQPRKSYRNVPNFLTSPHSANSSNYSEYNIDTKSNGSMKGMSSSYCNSGAAGQHHYHQLDQQQHAMSALSSAATSALETVNSQVKIEADQVFRDFAAAVASQQLQQISQTQMHHQAAAVAAAMADSSQNFPEHFRDSSTGGNTTSLGNANGNGIQSVANGVGIPSSSSSMKSPLSSPLPGVNGSHNSGAGHSTSTPQQAAAHSSSSNNIPTHGYHEANNEDDLDSSTGSNFNMKKPRVQLNTHVTSNMPHNNNHTNHSSNNINNSNTNNNINSNNNNSVANHSSASTSNFVDDTDDESDETGSNILQPQTILNDHHPHHHQDDNHYSDTNASTSTSAVAVQRNNGHNNNPHQQGMFSSNADFLFQLYQQLPHQQQQNHQQTSTMSQQASLNKFQPPSQQSQHHPPQRSSEHLLGELVTTELLKMSKERRKHVQKRILEILFFDD